ncbi:hypothetical protein Y032_0007g3499 [Ancylostoma ceylanicum]|nr:hypothetical protein Y032_0007g3499 [Ancylostoma ceylanicum]
MNHEFSVAEVMTTQGGTMCQYTEMTDAARKRVRAMHNWRRSQLALGNVQNGRNNYNCSQAANMYKMKYDCDLEKSALDYAKQCTLTPSVAYNQGENVHVGPLENDKTKAIATVGEKCTHWSTVIRSSEKKGYPGKTVNSTFFQAVKAWWGQIFRNGVNQRMIFLQNLRDKPNAPIAWSQMAWALSTRIGCAVVNCQSNTFTVCRYRQE